MTFLRLGWNSTESMGGHGINLIFVPRKDRVTPVAFTAA